MKANKLWAIITLLFILCGCEINAGTHVQYDTETGVINVTVSEHQNNIEQLIKDVDGDMESIQKTITDNLGIDVEFVVTPKPQHLVLDKGEDINDYSIEFSFSSIEEYNDFMSSKINDTAITSYDGLLIYAFSPNSSQYLKPLIEDVVKDLDYKNVSDEIIEIDNTFTVRNQFIGAWEIGSDLPRQDQVFDRQMYVEYNRSFFGKLKPETVKVEFLINEDIDVQTIESIEDIYEISSVENGYKAQRSFDATTNVMLDLLNNVFYSEMNDIQYYGFLDIECKSNILLKIYNISQCTKITDNIRSNNVQEEKLEKGFIFPNASVLNVYGDFDVHYIIDGKEAIVSDQSVIKILGIKRILVFLIPVFVLMSLIIYGVYRSFKSRNKYPLT